MSQRQSVFLNKVFDAGVAGIIGLVAFLLSSYYKNITIENYQFYFNIIFIVIPIFAGVIISVTLFYVGKLKNYLDSYNKNKEEDRELRRKLNMKNSTLKTDFLYQNSLFLSDAEYKKASSYTSKIFTGMLTFLLLLVWAAIYVIFIEKTMKMDSMVYVTVIMFLDVLTFTGAWVLLQRRVNLWSNKMKEINHYLTNLRLLLYQLENKIE
ncbi:MAG: hypothetical protein ACREAK_07105 [Nitrosarchaeum sp.]